MKKHHATLIFCIAVGHLSSFSTFAQSGNSYNARIQCSNNNTINNEYFSAANDMDAKNEVRRLLNNNTGYKGRNCRLLELTSDARRSQDQQPISKSYEVRIQCGRTSAGGTEYFSANSDLDAENEARRILNNNSGYRGRGCEITEIRSR